MKYVYKVKGVKVVGVKNVDDSYVLQPDEYESLVRFMIATFNGSDVIEGATQAEIDDAAEAEAERVANDELSLEITDGKQASLDLKVYLKRQLSVAQYKDARILVRPVWDALRVGDWDIALDEITIIDDANSTVISRKIKTTIENYLA